MRKHFLLALQLGVLGILVVWNNIFGVDYGFYWSVWWWDIPAHILGGMWAAIFFAWSCAEFNRPVTILECALVALAFGIGWEILEYFEGLQPSGFWSACLEVFKDLLDDVIGGFIAGYFVTVKRLKWRSA